MAKVRVSLESVRETSAKFSGASSALPLKMTSSMLEPRKDLALCSPSTQRMASETLDLPQPLGPTMAVTPASNSISVLPAKDLKPDSSSFLKCKRRSFVLEQRRLKPALRYL